MTAAELRRRVGRERWDGAFTFCFVRNPWDLAVSQYWWQRSVARGKDLDFERFVLRTAAVRSVWPIFAGKHGIEVDFVGRYEHLERDLAHALRTVGLDVPFELPRAKGGLRESRGDGLWTPAASAHVRKVFAREIDAFGYEEPDWVRDAIGR